MPGSGLCIVFSLFIAVASAAGPALAERAIQIADTAPAENMPSDRARHPGDEHAGYGVRLINQLVLDHFELPAH